MATDVYKSFVRQYEREAHEAYQRRGSQMRNTIRTVNNVIGSSTTFQKTGKGTAQQKQRHGKVPVMNIEHDPVECILQDWYAGDYVDRLDTTKFIHDEHMVLVNAGVWALGRRTDIMINDAANAGTNVSPTINLSTLTGNDFSTQAVEQLGERDVPDDGMRFGFVTWKVWNRMLQIEQFANSDYVSDRVWTGPQRPKQWLGVIWQPHSGLTKNGNNSVNPIWHQSAIGHAIGADVQTDITWHGDRAAHFINNMMSQGAVLIDNDGVQNLIVNEAA